MGSQDAPCLLSPPPPPPLGLSTGSAPVTSLYRRLLTNYPDAVCNDGSPATYFIPSEPHLPGQQVLVYLEGGGGCFDIESCTARCTDLAPHLCTTDPSTVRNFTGDVWSA